MSRRLHGQHHDDHLKHQKIVRDPDVIVADGTDMIGARGIDPTPARNTAVTAARARLTSKTGGPISRAHDD